MYNRKKDYIDKSKGKRNTINQKTNCFFDIIVILKEENWIY